MPKKSINNFSHKVYKLCSQIPKGRVSTYKLIAEFSFGSSSYARLAGKLLSDCPECKVTPHTNFQNYNCERIHCYRVIRTDFHLGGFVDEAGKSQAEIKRKKLASEGVFFDQKGYVVRNLQKKVIFEEFL
jgi:alkylated DNA nucleotide flippase Atl1